MIIPWGTDAPLYHRPFATIALIVINTLILVLVPREEYADYVLVLGDGIHPVQWLTNNFLHSGPIHLIGNMIFLWTFGLVVEGKLGWWRFTLVYLLLGVVDSGLMQTLVPSRAASRDARLLDDHLRHDGHVPHVGPPQRGHLPHLAATQPDRAGDVNPLVRRHVHRARRGDGRYVGRIACEPDERFPCQRSSRWRWTMRLGRSSAWSSRPRCSNCGWSTASTGTSSPSSSAARDARGSARPGRGRPLAWSPPSIARTRHRPATARRTRGQCQAPAESDRAAALLRVMRIAPRQSRARGRRGRLSQGTPVARRLAASRAGLA